MLYEHTQCDVRLETIRAEWLHLIMLLHLYCVWTENYWLWHSTACQTFSVTVHWSLPKTCSLSWTSMSTSHPCVLYSACTNCSRMIIVFVFYSINDTHVNTDDLQLNTCHLLSPVWSHCNAPLSPYGVSHCTTTMGLVTSYKLGDYDRAPHQEGPLKSPSSLCAI